MMDLHRRAPGPAPPAISAGVVRGIKHINIFCLALSAIRTVIGDLDLHKDRPGLRTRRYETGRGVLDSVVDQIDDHLDDEPGVHIRHQQIVLQFYRDMVLLRIAVQMGQGF